MASRIFRALALLATLLLPGCFTGERIHYIRDGMSRDEVITNLGNPDSSTGGDARETLEYRNRLISGWASARTDYYVLLREGRVVQFGPGRAPVYHLPSGAKVVLANGLFNSSIALDAESFELPKDMPESTVGKGAREGAGTAAQFCRGGGLLTLICAPVALAVGGTVGAMAATGEEQSVTIAEAAAQTKAIEDKYSGERDAIEKSLPVIAETLKRLRPLLPRVQTLARDTGVGNFVVLADEEPQSQQGLRVYDRNADYVFEMAVTRFVFEGHPKRSTYWLSVTAQGRLVRTHDNAVADTFVTTLTTDSRQRARWTAGDGKDAFEVLDAAFDLLATRFVEGWIAPTLQGTP